MNIDVTVLMLDPVTKLPIECFVAGSGVVRPTAFDEVAVLCRVGAR